MKSNLFSTVTAEGAEHGIPSYFNNSRKAAATLYRWRSGKGPRQHSPSSRLLAGRDGAWELGTGPAAPWEGARGVCWVW